MLLIWVFGRLICFDGLFPLEILEWDLPEYVSLLNLLIWRLFGRGLG